MMKVSTLLDGYLIDMNKDCKKFTKEFEELHPDRKIMFLIKAGSHFFDLNSPRSDTDYRGIYMPSLEEIYEGESRRRFFERKSLEGNKVGNKNTKEDTETIRQRLESVLEFY